MSSDPCAIEPRAIHNGVLFQPTKQVGKKNKSVGATAMNKDSSRSHSIFTITIETLEAGAGVRPKHRDFHKYDLDLFFVICI